jgi:hypothetical protein
MCNEDCYPHFNFNFQKIREYWKVNLGNHVEAEEYLGVVEKRLQYWLQECGSWIDFDFAVEHLQKHLNLREVESRLIWMSLRHRLRLANEQRRRLSPARRRSDEEEIRVDIKPSADGKHDAIWHTDFGNIYKRAMAREHRELRKLRETGQIPANESASPHRGVKVEKVRIPERPRMIQWMWANRLLPYLFERLREKEAICDDGEMWAALDGVFKDRHGEAITRKDLALWAHQYHNNKACEDEAGKPKKHQSIDQVIEEIEG